MKTRTLIMFLLICFGIGVSIYATSHHYDLVYGQSGTRSFCNLSDTVNCDAVNTSSMSEFSGIPVGLIGVVAFLIQLILLGVYRALNEDESPRTGRYLFYLFTINLVVSIILGSFSFLVLKMACIVCVAIYIVSILLFVLGFQMVRGLSMSHVISDVKNLFVSGPTGSRGTLILYACIPILSLLLHGMIKQNMVGKLGPLIETSMYEWNANKQFDFNTDNAPSIGNPNAPFQIVEFSDYQCPHCKKAAPSLKAFAMAHKDKVRLVFQQFPLDSNCNSSMKQPMHLFSCAMSRATLCAHKQGKFVEAHHWVFDHQETLNGQSAEQLQVELNLNKEAYDTCLKDPATDSEIKAQIDRALMAGLQGTPSIFVNGRFLPGGYLIPVLEEAYKTLK